MPKMKTNRSVKKRFKITASGKITSARAGKRHNMIKRSSKQIRQLRGTHVVNPTQARKIKPMAPYGL